MEKPDIKNDLKHNLERAKFLLGKVSLSRKNITWTIFYGYFLTFLLGWTLYVYMDDFNGWINIVAALLIYSTFLVVVFLLYHQIRKKRMVYTAQMVEIRSIIDTLVEMVDWTGFRGKKLDNKSSNSLSNIISSFDKERNAFMSPARKGFNCYKILISIQYTLSVIVFILAVLNCIWSIQSKPWVHF